MLIPLAIVHTIGYNSTESEPISIKSGALWVHCLGLALADFGRDLHSSESWRARRNFVFFCQVKARTTLQISSRPNFTKFEQNTSVGIAMNPVGTEFWKFSCRGRFSKKVEKIDIFQHIVTSRHHNSAELIDQQKFITKWPFYGMSSFHFTIEIKSKSFPWHVPSVQKTSPNFLLRRTRVDSMADSADISQSQTGSQWWIHHWVTWH